VGERPPVPRLHVIVNVGPDGSGSELVSTVAAAGAPLVQLRTKGGSDAERLAVADGCVRAARAHGSIVVVNDRADVCVAAGAHGVHGGLDDLSIPALRAVVGPARLVGGTARDPETGRAHEAAGADYLGVGPVYATTSKEGLPDPIGLEVLARVVAAVTIPVIAIAGITVDRLPDVMAAGAHGVAVIGAIAAATDPAAEVRRFLAAVEAP
jgi:thiamine-phosphate pyrophosphorylase